MSRFNSRRHMACPRYQTPTGPEDYQSISPVYSRVQQPRLPTWPLTFSHASPGSKICRESVFVIPHHQEGSHDPIRFDSIQPNRTCVPTPAGRYHAGWMFTLNNGRPARVESASESVSSATLGRRTSAPIPRSRVPRNLCRQTLLV